MAWSWKFRKELSASQVHPERQRAEMAQGDPEESSSEKLKKCGVLKHLKFIPCCIIFSQTVSESN